MKVAIHLREGSFSDKWLDYCERKCIPYKVVDCYSSSIIEDLDDCDILMWHWHHKVIQDSLFARQLIFALEARGKIVFPNFSTSMYFDDKLGQKYILEALNAPMVPSYIFYKKSEAINWARNAKYPKVFKLRGGSGGTNVQLVKNYRSAKYLINKSFGKGHSQGILRLQLKERLWIVKRDRNFHALLGLLKPLARIVFPTTFYKNAPRQRQYVYFQDYIPNNECDIRVVVIGDRSFAIKRLNRQNDFRASGSGVIEYDPSLIDLRCVKIAFDFVRASNTQCLAFDFIFDEEGTPLIVETSYAFTARAYEKCPGYWDSNLRWCENEVIPEHFMIEDLISDFEKKNVNSNTAHF